MCPRSNSFILIVQDIKRRLPLHIVSISNFWTALHEKIHAKLLDKEDKGLPRRELAQTFISQLPKIMHVPSFGTFLMLAVHLSSYPYMCHKNINSMYVKMDARKNLNYEYGQNDWHMDRTSYAITRYTRSFSFTYWTIQTETILHRHIHVDTKAYHVVLRGWCLGHHRFEDIYACKIQKYVIFRSLYNDLPFSNLFFNPRD